MAKRAICVGINDYPYEDSDLNGCLNDAKAWANLLTSHFGFTDVRLLLDTAATKENIMAGVKDLLDAAQEGDTLVYTFSGHGTYVADTSGDEAKYDEAQCPYDCANNLIIDDEWREMFDSLPDDVLLTVISDSCFSGSVIRVAARGPGMPTPDDRRIRFLSPKVRGGTVLDHPWDKQAEAKATTKELYPESSMKALLLTGCSDKQYSYDAMIDGVYHGAMTYHAIKAIIEANYELTAKELHAKLVAMVDDAGYPQTPQLEGTDAYKQRKLFS